jgi:hypothetical protein
MQESSLAAEAGNGGFARDAGLDGDGTAGLFGLVKGDVDRAIAPLWPALVAMASSWNLDIRPSVVLRAVALKALVTPAGARAMARAPRNEERDRWFLGMTADEAAVDATVLDEGERRLISNLLARQFVRDVVVAARARAASLQTSCCENHAFIDAWTGARP